jgi:hypothetical protein
MRSFSRPIAIIVLFVLVWSCRSARADEGAVPPTGTPPVSTSPQPGAADNSKLIGAILIGAGAVAIGVGAYLAATDNPNCGPQVCSEYSTNRAAVGLAIGFAGAVTAMGGTFLWFRVPKTPARVALTGSGFRIFGSF